MEQISFEPTGFTRICFDIMGIMC